MLEPPQHLRLAVESTEYLCGDDTRLDHFQRDQTARMILLRLVDGAHPTLAEGLENVIRAEVCRVQRRVRTDQAGHRRRRLRPTVAGSWTLSSVWRHRSCGCCSRRRRLLCHRSSRAAWKIPPERGRWLRAVATRTPWLLVAQPIPDGTEQQPRHQEAGDPDRPGRQPHRRRTANQPGADADQ